MNGILRCAVQVAGKNTYSPENGGDLMVISHGRKGTK